MRPFDSRLLRIVPSVRIWVGVVIAAGVVSGVFAIGLAVALSWVLTQAVQHHITLTKAGPCSLLVVLLAIGRGVLTFIAEQGLGHHGARDVIRELRRRLFRTLADGGPSMLSGRSSGAIASAATTGLDSLDIYFARYLPQLILAVGHSRHGFGVSPGYRRGIGPDSAFYRSRHTRLHVAGGLKQLRIA